MKRLVIVGAGGFAREVLSYALAHPACGTEWQPAGFLDDNPGALTGFDTPVGLLGSIRDHRPAPDELFVNGLGLPEAKRRCVEALKARGATFISLVHPSALIGASTEVGEGTVICPGVVLTCDIRLGVFNVLNCLSTVGHDAVIGDWTTLSGHCDITGHVTVGSGVFFGSRASVIPGRRVGDNAVVGAGAVVVGHVPEGRTVFGNPAKVLK
jgi:sugar O-acyltransferase (sialic acid O-acetyltransferase NeuD family)